MESMDGDGLNGKTVVVMGLGRFGGGLDSAQFAAGRGAKVIVTDLATAEKLSDSIAELEATCRGLDLEFHLGSHEPRDFQRADIVIANPAVPADNRFLQIARQAGARVTSQIALFFASCPAPIVGITGANGKSTTTALAAHLLRGARRGGDVGYGEVWLGGNIGNEPLLTILDRVRPEDVVVVEVSSFQIEQLAAEGLAPHVALLTNLTANHLDRYGTFDAYCAAKAAMFDLQRPRGGCPAVSLFNRDDEVARTWFEKYRVDAGRICRLFCAADVSEAIRKEYRLPGRAYLANLAGAIAIGWVFGVSDEAVAGCLAEFHGLNHRLELVQEVGGVRWYNDSKATTPLSAMVALEAFDAPVVIIAGGYDKRIAFDEFGSAIAGRAKAAVLIGQTAPAIEAAIKAAAGRTVIQRAGSLGEAVNTAGRLAEPGDVVLLSPACASYDMFENFEKRGEEFRRCVRRLGGRA